MAKKGLPLLFSLEHKGGKAEAMNQLALHRDTWPHLEDEE